MRSSIPIFLEPPRRCHHCGAAALLPEPDPVPPAGLPRRTRGYTLTCLLCAREAYVLAGRRGSWRLRRQRRGRRPRLLHNVLYNRGEKGGENAAACVGS